MKTLGRPDPRADRQTLIKDMFIPQADESDMNMNTDTCSFHQFVMVLAHFQPSTNKTQDTDINSRHEIINCHLMSHSVRHVKIRKGYLTTRLSNIEWCWG